MSEYSRHETEYAAHRQLRWLQEAREGNRTFKVEFNPYRDPEKPYRVLSEPYWRSS